MNKQQQKQENKTSQKKLISLLSNKNQVLLYNAQTKQRSTLNLNFKIPPGMGVLNLQNSFILAGGQAYDDYFKDVYQINGDKNHLKLPSLRVQRSYFPLAQLYKGLIILSIGGYLGRPIDVCQQLIQFKKWTFLPGTNYKLHGRSACSVNDSIVYAFGGYSLYNPGSVIEMLDYGDLSSGWVMLDLELPNCRGTEGCLYSKQRSKIVIFGYQDQGDVIVEIDIDDKNKLLPSKNYNSMKRNFRSQLQLQYLLSIRQIDEKLYFHGGCQNDQVQIYQFIQ